ncbi:tRNA (adenine(22)-N(1))-methyltransferase TrmK [Mediterraneibacter glycyrrhizinilyticus]|uniref:tRNA (adenine(22)-N(1))-methyltransferase n=1 Tax=Mediterraneibacter glycyrrhizinilyticus TaxID=342942 RepID=UPI00265A7E86|nr:class I SAM-dependent methyltransferase [Mediterraneibacter glycyrrhizinilyticus]MCF2569570.1 tRNA (adenine(22)-N(1))-methyltransferase TrmK [Mediterraneibacter glycyrrhizinilyticus]
MELSKRLSAVAALVTDGYRLADIGTDHAYIPICLAGAGRIPEAVAMDVNQGPLFRAEENIRMHGLEDRIKTRISDGFASLEKGEADAAVIAGMGGPLMIRILREGAEVVSTLKECVLQPQSEIEKVRAFLLEEGFFFLDEDMVEEDGKYYPMMKVQPLSDAEKAAEDRSGTAWTRTELCYGKLLLMRKNPILKEFLQREICIRRRILNELKNNKSLKAVQRRQELEEELKTAEKGMDYYAV